MINFDYFKLKKYQCLRYLIHFFSPFLFILGWGIYFFIYKAAGVAIVESGGIIKS